MLLLVRILIVPITYEQDIIIYFLMACPLRRDR